MVTGSTLGYATLKFTKGTNKPGLTLINTDFEQFTKCANINSTV